MSNEAQLQLFARGVIFSIKLWEAYQIALDAAQRTDETPVQISTRLAEELVDAFESGSATEENVELFLREFVDGELDCLVEDESEKTLARELVRLWQGVQGETQWAKGEVERLEERAARTVRTRAVKPQHSHDSDSSSDESDREQDQAGTTLESFQEQDQPATSRRVDPVIDEDGFETVQRRKR